MKFPLKVHVFQKLATFLLLCAMTVASPLAWSATAGKVVVAKGTVSATAGGQSRALQRRALVNERDTVNTGAASRTQLRFIDSALLTLNENSALAIEQYSFTGAGGSQDKVLMRLVRGGFRTVTGAIGKKNNANYKVETPLASIGIRGTIYTAQLSDALDVLTVTVQEGDVTVTVEGGSSITIGPGREYNAVRVRRDGSMEPFRVQQGDQSAAGGETFKTDSPDDNVHIGITHKPGYGDSSFESELQQ